MRICIDFGFLRDIESQDLLTYFALLLAYLAYAWSINRDLDTWHSLFLSFKEELKLYESWLGGEGYKSSKEYVNKGSYWPYNNIYPLVFIALPEIIRRGTEELRWIPKKFSESLLVFNNRVTAFNSVLDKIKLVSSNDPILSERLHKKLTEFGLDNDAICFDDFKQKIKEMAKNKDEQEIAYLAEHIRRLNILLHVRLIADKNKEDMLHNLFISIRHDMDSIIKKFDDYRPWFIRFRMGIALFSLIIFFLIESNL